jgi:fatty-acyl-CoA synthase
MTADDVCLPVVPMFHANAWCFPFSSVLAGVKHVYPGPHLDPVSLLDAFESQRVTVSAGVPTIWMGILQTLDANPGRWDLSAMRTMTVGGAAPPRAMIEAFGERHGLHITHGWGMTEMCPIGTISGAPGQEAGLSPDEAYDRRALQGPPIPFVEIRARGGEGLVPWDGATMGELEVRGPSIASAYYDSSDSADRWTVDGWFKTGDIVTIHPDAYVEIQDRSKDLVKSGGEWISSVALENALMGHPSVAEAAVIAVPDETWSERPLGVVVLHDGATATPEELREFLAPRFAKWWLPDRFEFVDEIPKTAVGKFRKTVLRERFATTATKV